MSSSRLIAAAVGVLALLCLPAGVRAQSVLEHVATVASGSAGSIAGVVRDEHGSPAAGVMVSAFGPGRAIAVTDRGGRFELRALPPGPYVLRAHGTGFVGSPGQVVEVRASARSASSIALRRTSAGSVPSTPGGAPVLAAGVGGAPGPEPSATTADPASASNAPSGAPDSSSDDDHGEVAWRLRHVRRGVLRDVIVPVELLTDAGLPDGRAFGAGTTVGSRFGSSARVGANVFSGLPVTGQFNLLTAGSFDTSQQLFAGDSLSHSVAYVTLAAPAGSHADWSVRGALTQGDLSSWFVAGAYTRRGPGPHHYDVGLSYSTQRHDSGNPEALRNATDGSRNVGAVYAFDTVELTPSAAVTFGARFSRYDYLADSAAGLLNPRIELAVSPDPSLHFKILASRRALAPGAEEFLPPTDLGLWLPPQRTFSALGDGAMQPERTDHVAVEAERDFGLSRVSLRVFHQHVSDQLLTMFGLDMPGEPSAKTGHYFVGNVGDLDATGWSASLQTKLVSSRVHGTVEYSLTDARWSKNGTAYLMVLTPATSVRPSVDRLQGLSTSIETQVPETATRVLVIYRLTGARNPNTLDGSVYDSRFDVQVHQSLPFMDFSSARWEMLLAVRNTFREATPESSVYDELLVARAPKRIVGGLTLRF